jgi:putative ABC transport system permease protein
MVAGAILLGIVAASTPLFLSSSGADALAGAIRQSSRFGSGLSISFRKTVEAPPPGGGPAVPAFAMRDEVLSRATAGIPHLGDTVVTALGAPVAVDSPTERRSGAGPLRPVFRTGAVGHVQRLEGDGGPGAWIQDAAAQDLRVHPGDEITLLAGHREVDVRVAGIYGTLADAPSTPFWEPLGREFRPPNPDAPLPATFLLVERAAFAPLMEDLGQTEADFRWEYPLALREPLDLTAATGVADRLAEVTSRVLDTHSQLGRQFVCHSCLFGNSRVTAVYNLDQDIRKARETVASLEPSIDLLSIAGALVALVVLGAAGLYSVQRRRTEVRFLMSRGIGPAALGVKAALEALIPCAAGAVIGLGVSLGLITWFGPGDALDPAGVADAARAFAVALPIALVTIGAVSGASAMKLANVSAKPSRLARIPWEVPVLAVAGLALRRIMTGSALVSDPDTGIRHTSALAILFPVLFIGATAGLASRAFKSILRVVRGRVRSARGGLYLAVNRLASAKRLAITLITASALAFGIFVYAQTMAASVRATTTAKSFVFTGSDVSIPVNDQYVVPSDFDFPYTKTTERIDGGQLEPSNQTIDVIGVDPATFESAAFWDKSFSDRPLSSLLESLEEPADGFVRVIVAGDLPAGQTLDFGGVEIPFRVVGRAESFPGKFLDRTLIVVNSATVEEPVEAAGGLNPLTTTGAISNLWIKGDPDAIERSLGNLGFPPDEALAARDVLRQPAFVSVSRTFGFLKALGVGAALLVVVGTVLYIQSRQRGRAVAYALARRMGLAPRSHLGALVLELGTMLGLSLVLGLLLGALSSAFVFGRIDLLPAIPPRALLRIPLGVTLPLGIVLAVVTLGGAWRAHRSAEKADIAGALRSGA